MDTARLEQLREGLRGTLTTPADEGYDTARQVYNAMIDRHPAAIVQPANAGDVMTAVRFAGENGLERRGPRWFAQRAGLRDL